MFILLLRFLSTLRYSESRVSQIKYFLWKAWECALSQGFNLIEWGKHQKLKVIKLTISLYWEGTIDSFPASSYDHRHCHHSQHHHSHHHHMIIMIVSIIIWSSSNNHHSQHHHISTLTHHWLHRRRTGSFHRTREQLLLNRGWKQNFEKRKSLKMSSISWYSNTECQWKEWREHLQ